MKQYVQLKKSPVLLRGELPKVGNIAPNAALLNGNLEEIELSSFVGKKILLNIFPSIDTPVCSKAMKELVTQCGSKKDLMVVHISNDLPFALSRFCMAENIANAVVLSGFRSDFGTVYGMECVDGPIRGLLARTLILLDSNFKISYVQLVPEISQEPDYTAVIKAIDAV